MMAVRCQVSECVRECVRDRTMGRAESDREIVPFSLAWGLFRERARPSD